MDLLTGLAIAERAWSLIERIRKSARKKARKAAEGVWRPFARILYEKELPQKESDHEQEIADD